MRERFVFQREMRLRLISAAILIPVMLVVTWYGEVAFALIVALISWLVLYEWLRMIGCGYSVRLRWVGWIGLAVVALAALTQPIEIAAGIGAAAALVAALVAWSARFDVRVRWVAAGIVYASVAVVALIELRKGDDGFGAVMFVFLIAWATDTFAFIVGRKVGGPRLWRAVSPSKTWSGALGGLAAGTLFGAIVAVVLGRPDHGHDACRRRLRRDRGAGGRSSGVSRQAPLRHQGRRLDHPRARRRDGPRRRARRGGGGDGGPRQRRHHGGTRDGLVDPDGSMTGRVVLFGATGSVGTSAMAAIEAGGFDLVGVAANANVEALAAIAERHRPELTVVADEARGGALKARLDPLGLSSDAGSQALEALAALDADRVVMAIPGFAALRPTLAAIDAGRIVCLANKECLVAAGELVLARAKASGATILPVDSEHNAIFQVFDGAARGAIRRIVLTASGGPFRTASRERMAAARPEDALKHPNWSMGAKITIDSATMMNKGLEVIEAHHLFQVGPERIGVVVHPQSIVHGMVEYADGSSLAHLSNPSMVTPIAHCLYYPARGAPLSRRSTSLSGGR